MIQKTTKLEKMVGLMVIAALLGAGGTVIAKAQKGHFFEDPLHLRIQTTKGFGIVAGTVVKFHGVDVGSVEEVGLDPLTARVQSTLVVLEGYAPLITRSSVAHIDQPPIFGDTVINIVKSDLPDEVQDQAQAQDGDALGVMEPVNLFDKIGVTAGDVSDLVKNLNQTMTTVQRAVVNIETITGRIIEGQGTLGALLNDKDLYTHIRDTTEHVSQMLGKVNQGTGTIGRLLNEEGLYTETDQAMKQINEVLANAKSLTGRLDETAVTLNRTLDRVEGTMKELQDVMAGINRGEGSIGKLMKDDAVFVEVKRILVELRESIEDAREQAPISTFVGAVFGAF